MRHRESHLALAKQQTVETSARSLTTLDGTYGTLGGENYTQAHSGLWLAELVLVGQKALAPACAYDLSTVSDGSCGWAPSSGCKWPRHFLEPSSWIFQGVVKSRCQLCLLISDSLSAYPLDKRTYLQVISLMTPALATRLGHRLASHTLAILMPYLPC